MVYTSVMSITSGHRDIAPRTERAVYVAAGGELLIDVRIDSETVWLTQEQIARLFDVERSVISKHIANIHEEAELGRASRAIL